MGTDFTYSAAPYWFDQLDALIRNVNAVEGDKINVFYSNPVGRRRLTLSKPVLKLPMVSVLVPGL